MKTTRILALLLALATLLTLLASCDGGRGNGDGGDRVGDSWDGVDFKGQEVRMSISVNQYEECSFPAASIYTKGPDEAGTNEVAKEVLARNARASEELGIDIVYSTTDLRYPDVFANIENIVMTSASNSPDIYSNDLLGLGKAMVNGYLWNVKNPGNVKNYFDFTKEGWYEEYIKGCTFDQEKLYIFAGDYFIDMIRMAWVIYVNEDLLNANISKLPQWETIDDFYGDVLAGFWELDDLTAVVTSVHTDGVGGTMGTADQNDDLIGMTVNHTTDWVLASSSDVNVYYQDKTDGYKPKVRESVDIIQKVSDKWINLKESRGTIETASTTAGVKEATTIFLGGKTMFTASRLGEMESEALRGTKFSKGLVPFPKWSLNEQDDYHTVIHNQVELGCILNTAKAYSAASALMQFLNEESDQVVYTYYDKGLKYKYNDNKNAREMMDLVRDTSDAPFGFEIGDYCHEIFYSGTTPLALMYLDNNATLSSTFAAEKDVYKECLAKMIERFAKFE